MGWAELYLCLYVKEFPAQALLRLRPELHNPTLRRDGGRTAVTAGLFTQYKGPATRDGTRHDTRGSRHFPSANRALTFAPIRGSHHAGLVDEYRLYFRPYVLGTGKPYFAGPRPALRLMKLDAIGEDAVRLTYAPA